MIAFNLSKNQFKKRKLVERGMSIMQKLELVDEYLKAKIRNIFKIKKLKMNNEKIEQWK